MKTLNHVLLFVYAMTGWAIPVMSQEQPSGSRYLEERMPERWNYIPEFSQTLPDEDIWWESFKDPMLDSLIAEGVEKNYNVKIAMQRIMMARQAVGQAAADYYPMLSINAGYNKSRMAGAMNGSDIPSTNSSYFSLGMDMNWEIDLFGRITAQVKGKKAAVEASKSNQSPKKGLLRLQKRVTRQVWFPNSMLPKQRQCIIQPKVRFRQSNLPYIRQ